MTGCGKGVAGRTSADGKRIFRSADDNLHKR
jgi:hypothetical protein